MNITTNMRSIFVHFSLISFCRLFLPFTYKVTSFSSRDNICELPCEMPLRFPSRVISVVRDTASKARTSLARRASVDRRFWQRSASSFHRGVNMQSELYMWFIFIEDIDASVYPRRDQHRGRIVTTIMTTGHTDDVCRRPSVMPSSPL